MTLVTDEARGVEQRILKAARHAFGQHGYTATSLRTIAKQAQVTKPMVYYYYASKEGLFWAVVEQALLTVQQSLRQAIAKQSNTRAKLHALALAYVAPSEELHFINGCLNQSAGLALPTSTANPLWDLQRNVMATLFGDSVVNQSNAAIESEMFCRAFFGALHSLRLSGEGAKEQAAMWVDLLWQGIAAHTS